MLSLCVATRVWKIGMSITSYFKPRSGLPDPKTPLLTRLPSRAIVMANQEAEKVLREAAKLTRNVDIYLLSFSLLQRTGHDRCVVPASTVIPSSFTSPTLPRPAPPNTTFNLITHMYYIRVSPANSHKDLHVARSIMSNNLSWTELTEQVLSPNLKIFHY